MDAKGSRSTVQINCCKLDKAFMYKVFVCLRTLNSEKHYVNYIIIFTKIVWYFYLYYACVWLFLAAAVTLILTLMSILYIFGDESSLNMVMYGTIFEMDRIRDEWNSCSDEVGLLLRSKWLSNQEKKRTFFGSAVGHCRNILLQSTPAVMHPALNWNCWRYPRSIISTSFDCSSVHLFALFVVQWGSSHYVINMHYIYFFPTM